MAHHAILGAGGVGGFVGAILGAAGHQVTLVTRPGAAHPETLSLESPYGNATAPVRLTSQLDEPADVLWVTVKATQLDTALAEVDPSGPRTVVPLLNGIDHAERLRRVFGDRVVPGTFAGEAERVSPGHIVHRSRLARLSFPESARAALAEATNALTGFGCSCVFMADEATLLWSKLVMLAPFALTTTARPGTIGEVRDDPAWRERLEGAAREACRVAVRAGAAIDEDAVIRTFANFERGMRSSMSKDVAAGRPPELDAIAGPVLRGGARFGVDVSVTASLASMVEKL